MHYENNQIIILIADLKSYAGAADLSTAYAMRAVVILDDDPLTIHSAYDET